MLFQTHSVMRSVHDEFQRANGFIIWTRKAAIGILMTSLIALCAHISILLPLTLIPITMQTFAVLLLGMILGPFEGMGVLIMYLAEGAVGLPVLSPHGLGGWAQLFGPSGGYLLSYPLAVLLTSACFSAAKRYVPIFLASMISALLADTLILCTGAVWLGFSFHISFASTLAAGVLPFLVGEALKVALVASTITALQYSERVTQR